MTDQRQIKIQSESVPNPRRGGLDEEQSINAPFQGIKTATRFERHRDMWGETSFWMSGPLGVVVVMGGVLTVCSSCYVSSNDVVRWDASPPFDGLIDQDVGMDAVVMDGGGDASVLQDELPTGLREGAWTLSWNDEFDGPENTLPPDPWFFFDGWEHEGVWRDAHYTKGEQAYLDGQGHLAIDAVLIGDELHSAYLQTYDWTRPRTEWLTFGSEQGRYFEAAIRLDGLNAGGLWFAFWLFAPSDTYDGNPDTGTEMDIMEYVVAYGAEGSWTRQLPERNTLNYIHVANIWSQTDSSDAFIDASDLGVDLRDGRYHHFGLEWEPGLLVFYLDHMEVFRTQVGVSTSDNEAVMLSLEYDEGPDDAWGLNENVHDYAAWLPNRVLVDYVRVYSRSAGDG